ncbi:MAG: Ger(x)C family spore germination C-terminal domain-containing protein [Clostridia bacterium]
MDNFSKNSFFKNKMVVVFLAVLVILFIVNDYANENVDSIAVVVGIGVDLADDGGYQVSCEVLTPQDGSGGSGAKDVVLTGRGGTIAEGIDDVFKRIGWYPKLNYCNVLILSKDVAKAGAIDALSYFLKTEKIMDSALIVVSENKAIEILEAATPLDNVSSQAVQKIAMQKYKHGANIIEINLKDFMKNFYDEGVNDILTVVKTDNAVGHQSEEDKQKIKKKNMEVFDLTSSAIFYQGKLVGEINADLTNAYVLAKDNAKDSTLIVKDVSSPYINGGKNVDVTLDIIKHKNDIEVSLENGKPKIKISVEMEVQFNDASKREGFMTFSLINQVPLEVITKATDSLKFDLMELFEISRKTKSDIFAVGNSLSKYNNKKWREYLLTKADSSDYLNDTQIEVDVKIKSVK